MVLALNNPYGAVVRGHVQDYFASGTVSPYRAMWAAGMRVPRRPTDEALARVSGDPALAELAAHHLVELRAERLDEAALIGREDDVDPFAQLLPHEPRRA